MSTEGNRLSPASAPPDVDLEAWREQPLEDQALEAAEIDGVRIVHRRERFPQPGSRAEKRAERAVALCFVIAFLGALAFAVCYIVLPWQYGINSDAYSWFTPVLGVTMAISLFGFGFGAVLWAKLLIPEEEAVQERHGGRSDVADRETTAAVISDGLGMTGIARRSLLQKALGLSGLALGALAIIPLGGLIKKPKGELFRTGWADGVRLMTVDRRLIRPGDLEAGGIATVFPRHSRRPDHAGRGRLRRAADPAPPGPGGVRAPGPGGLRLAGLPGLLEDLHARRLPGLALRAADRPAAVPVPPVAVQPARGRQAGLRPGGPPVAKTRDHGG